MERIVSAVERAVGECRSLLDVGCGDNSPVGRFAARPGRSVGIDKFGPWLAESVTRGIHDEYVEMDVLAIGDRFAPEAFDVVLCCDLLEHLEKDDGERLLGLMEVAAADRVVVLTPNGFVPQGATWGNPHQVHRSGWSAGELRARGYTVIGLGGLALLRGERGPFAGALPASGRRSRGSPTTSSPAAPSSATTCSQSKDLRRRP